MGGRGRGLAERGGGLRERKTTEVKGGRGGNMMLSSATAGRVKGTFVYANFLLLKNNEIYSLYFLSISRPNTEVVCLLLAHIRKEWAATTNPRLPSRSWMWLVVVVGNF